MRPVTRGQWPQNQQGEPIRYSDYATARPELIKRLGEYCSYCEMHLDASLAVEHVQPKKPPGAPADINARKFDWLNFLLSCTNCNSIKGSLDVVLDDYLWPDKDNTLRALVYLEGGIITVNDDLTAAIQHKAQATIELTGLDRQPLNNVTASDRRWLNRRETWDMAVRSKARLVRNDNDDFKAQIIETALSKGFWSIWMSVYADSPDMLRRLIQTFTGTCEPCFDQSDGFLPLGRTDGQC